MPHGSLARPNDDPSTMNYMQKRRYLLMLPTPMNIAHDNTMWATNYKQALPKSSGFCSSCCSGFVGNCCLFPEFMYGSMAAVRKVKPTVEDDDPISNNT